MEEKYYDTPGWKPTGGYESGFDYIARTSGNRPVQHMSSQEPGYKSAEHYWIENGDKPVQHMSSQEPGYKSAEHYWNEVGDRPAMYYGPNIDGKRISDLIENNEISPQTIKEVDYEQVYQDIMLGFTNDKNLLANKIDLILSKEEIIINIIMNQYSLAVKELMQEKRGFYDNSSRDRKFQFLSTLCILKEKGYDVNSIKFQNGDGKDVDFVQLLSMFEKQCRKYSPVKLMNNSPFWFKEKQPVGYEPKKYTSPASVVTELLRAEYDKEPKRFINEYEGVKRTSRVPEVQNQTFDNFMMQYYGFVPRDNRLEEFNRAKEAQRAEDTIRTSELLESLKEETFGKRM